MESIWKKNSLCCAVLNRFLFRLGILTASLLHHLMICKTSSSRTQVTAPLIFSSSISKLGQDFCLALVFQAWVSWDHGPTCLDTLVAYNFWHWCWIWCGHILDNVSLSTSNERTSFRKSAYNRMSRRWYQHLELGEYSVKEIQFFKVFLSTK